MTPPAATLGGAYAAPSAAPSAAPELLYLLHADPEELAAHLSGLRAADVADALNGLAELHGPARGAAAASAVLAALPFDLAVEVLDQPELERPEALFPALDARRCASLLDAMSADRRAYLFRALPAAERPRLLATLTPAAREGVELLLRYPPDTAGGLMTTEFVSVPATRTAGAVLDLVRRVGREQETVYAVFVTDPRTHRLLAAVALHDLLDADPATPVLDAVGAPAVRRAPLAVAPTTDREQVARLFAKYNLLALPVVDEGGHVLGIVTVDDVIDALVREQTEDIQKLGGVGALDVPYPQIGFARMVGKRAGWLSALFLSEMLTATAMQRFEGEIERAAVLAMFIPLVMSSGGNSGSQATSLVIRALALGEVRVRDWWRVAARELPTGLALGAILGAIGVGRILLWQHLGLFDYTAHGRVPAVRVALTVGTALVGIVAFGSLAGSMLPFLLKRLGFDPASASAPFVATLVDVTGLVIYFSVALLVLRGTLL